MNNFFKLHPSLTSWEIWKEIIFYLNDKKIHSFLHKNTTRSKKSRFIFSKNIFSIKMQMVKFKYQDLPQYCSTSENITSRSVITFFKILFCKKFC